MEENKTFEINEETVVLEPEEVEVVDELTEVETTEEPEEEKKSNSPNMLLAGAAIVGIATAGYKIFKKVKARKNQKEDLDLDINKIREDVVTKLTNEGRVDKYTQFDIDMMANYIYDLTEEYNLK